MAEKIVKDSQGLAKELVNDTISRKAAIEAIKEDKIDLTNPNVVAVFKATGDFEKVETQVMTCDRHIKILKDLPSAQSYTDEEIQKMQDIEQAQLDKAYEMGKADAMRWIPCGERLPDRFGEMLVTFIPAAGTLWTRVIIAHYSDLMGIAKPCFWIGNVGKSDFANITSQVVAWMPLPEPYKEDDHETD